MKMIDTNKDGSISKAELFKFFEGWSGEQVEQITKGLLEHHAVEKKKKAWAALDKNKDGFADKDDIVEWIRYEPYFASQNAQAKANVIMNRLDKNHDGRITQMEFFEYFKGWTAHDIDKISHTLVECAAKKKEKNTSKS